jgi:hypothetical protein
MPVLKLLRPDIAIPLMREFLGWYFIEMARIPRRGFSYSKAFTAILSIPFLLRTLFAPWKNIVERPKQLNIYTIGPMLALNGISRCIGAVIRLGAIIVAIAAQIVLLAFTLGYLLLWIVYPLALLFVLAHITVVLLA